jgi:branched-chain amino acid transport system substrate-binding protein
MTFKNRLFSSALIGSLLIAGNASAEQIFKIGIVQSTTGGSAALYGVEQKNAIEQAIDEINASGELGDIKLVGIHQDDGADRGQTVNIFQKLINQDKVQAILGASLSSTSFAADPIAQAAGVPVIASSNTAVGLTNIGDYIFRTSPPEFILFPGVLKFAQDKYGIKRAAQIYGIDDQLMKSAYNTHKKALEDAGIEIVATETFDKGDIDFSAQLTKIKAANPDVIVLASLAEEAAGIVRQARQLGISDKVLFLGSNAVISNKLFDLAGPAANGLLVGAAWYAGYPSPKNQAFVSAYEKRYGHKPDVFGAQAYDATYILANAIKKTKTVSDRKTIRDALAETKDFQGVIGTLSFSPTREPLIEAKVLEARDGRFQPAQ